MLQPYVDAEGMFIEFDYKQALKDGLSPKLVNKAKKDYEKANEYIAKKNAVSKQSQFSVMAATCGGVNRFEGNLVAGTVYIDSCRTEQLIAIIAGGAGVSALISLLPGAAAVSIVAGAIYTLGGAVLAYNNAGGTGVKIRVLRNPITKNLYPYWVKPQ